ncbi:MAG TPA: hypothetical protein VFJ74_10795 [Gemmatimonadaceae bacterium]|nr:hypothetical protein [Gemmatimonadaceae bacterium]
MGVLSDLVAAPSTAAEAIGRTRGPARQFGGIDIKGIDTIKLGMLHAMLTGETFESLFPAYDPVVSVSDDGPWVFELPSALVQRLGALDEPALSATAASWARTEEFEADGWSPKDVHAVLRDICAVARQARSAEHSLFLWMSV